MSDEPIFSAATRAVERLIKQKYLDETWRTCIPNIAQTISAEFVPLVEAAKRIPTFHPSRDWCDCQRCKLDRVIASLESKL